MTSFEAPSAIDTAPVVDHPAEGAVSSSHRCSRSDDRAGARAGSSTNGVVGKSGRSTSSVPGASALRPIVIQMARTALRASFLSVRRSLYRLRKGSSPVLCVYRGFAPQYRTFCAPGRLRRPSSRRPIKQNEGPSMNLHEYQSKRLFAEYGIPVPKGIPATTADEAREAATKLGGELWVVKAQVHAGGRGKAGGVKLARSIDEVADYAAGMLGTMLVTHQSGPEGLPVNTVYVEAGSDIERELYLSMLVDREASRIRVARLWPRARQGAVRQLGKLIDGLYRLFSNATRASSRSTR
jgi:hypothetical protein